MRFDLKTEERYIMPVNDPPITYNEDIMSQYENTYIQLIEKGCFGLDLIDGMKTTYGTRALPFLVMMCGDGDFFMTSLFNRFQIRSLVRSAYNAKSSNYAVDQDFLDKLSDRAFWELSRKQMLKLTTELTFLYPTKFAFLKRWEEQYHNIGVN